MTQADHLITRQAGDMSIAVIGETLILYAVHGEQIVKACNGDVIQNPNEALVLDASDETITLHQSADTEVYILRFRQKPTAQRQRLYRLVVPNRVKVSSAGRLIRLLRWIIEEKRGCEPSPVVVHNLVVLVLSELARFSAAAGATIDTRYTLESIASRVDAYIAAHFHEPIGTPEIARELRYNPDYLERVYSKERRISIRETVHARRVREACARLLLHHDTAVAEIGALCGFPDPSHFCRVFKRAMNLTPGAYRRSPSVARASSMPRAEG